MKRSPSRFYPRAWRERYGEELDQYLVDRYGDNVPFRARRSLLLAGWTERARCAGAIGPVTSRNTLRGASLVTLGCYMIVVLAGLGVAKFSEHWDAAVGSGFRALPSFAINLMQVAAVVGFCAVMLAAVVVAPSFLRALREHGLGQFRSPLRSIAIALGVLAIVSVPVLIMSSSPKPNWSNVAGGQILALVWVLSIAAFVATTYFAVCAVVLKLEIPRRALNVTSWLALLLLVDMAAVLIGTVLWWESVATHGLTFLGSDAPTPLVIAGLMMTVAVIGAAWSVRRVGIALRLSRTN